MLVRMIRHYRALGGLAAWRVPTLTAGLLLGAALLGELEMAIAIAIGGGVLTWIEGSRVIEVSPVGLSEGLLIGGRLLGAPPTLPWHAVTEIDTGWISPRATTALVTEIRGTEGPTIRLTTQMGLRAYRHLVAVAVERAPGARLTGLSRDLLADDGSRAPLHEALADRALMLAAGVLVAWAVALPWIFARY
jgi:hypothetical protein